MIRYIMFAAALLCLLFCYLFFRIRKLLRFYGADLEKKWVKAVNALLAAGISASCLAIFWTGAVVALYAVGCSAILDLIVFMGRTAVRRRQAGRKSGGAGLRDGKGFFYKLYQSGLLPALFAAAVFVYGWQNMQQIRLTVYQAQTEKDVTPYRIALLTDVHYDSVQDSSVLKDKIQEINEQNVDIVVLGGDIVEEGTSKEKMQEVFQLLGGIKNRHGVYYVYGNHDRQPYTNRRTYTDEELEQAILTGGIEILEDSFVEIGGDLILAGRKDAAWGQTKQRASVGEILEGADREKYVIMADHQPVDAEENAAQGVDLELSGHTHAGQIWPMGVLSEWFGALNYGEYEKDGCKVIVSSGVAGWAYTIRTGKHCEYVIVELS